MMEGMFERERKRERERERERGGGGGVEDQRGTFDPCIVREMHAILFNAPIGLQGWGIYSTL